MRFPATYLKLLERWGTNPAERIEPASDYALVYPPVGFMQWEICHIGNGDAYGYYWAVGREDDDPVVAMMSHDCAALNPLASSLEGLALLGGCREATSLVTTGEFPANDDDDDEELEDEEEAALLSVVEKLKSDDRSPYLLVANGDLALGENDLARAESLYLEAVELLPEYTSAHYGLVILYRRMRQPAKAVHWMVEAIRSPLCFRGASFWADTSLPTDHVNRQDYRRKCLMWLQQARPEQSAGVADDPLYQARGKLTFAHGVPTDDDYRIYDDAIEAYLQQGRGVDAVRLAMTYGELMMRETTPFRERYGFTAEGYRQRLVQLFRAANLGSRVAFLERT
jgi:tetratricopeptide (TPR) repeat protein